MIRTLRRNAAWQIGCLAITVILLGDAAVLAQGRNARGDSFSAIMNGPLAGSDGTSYAGRVYNPLTTRGRAGSVMPVFREARLRQAGEVEYEPGTVHETIVTPAPDMGVEYESEYESGPVFSDPGCDCDGGCDTCDECGLGGGCGTCDECGCGLGREWDVCDEADECVPLCLPRFRHLSLFAGVHAFKGPRDNGFANNFGFQQGINVSGRAPFLRRSYIGYQLGYQATQSRLHGDLVTLSETTRRQHLVTAGLFHRRQVGLQWGVVYDLMRDDLVQDLDFSQIRAELSLIGPRGGEIGFWTAIHANDAGYLIDGQLQFTFQAADQYQLFYRWHFVECGEARLWAGMTNHNDGLFGGEFLLPIDDRWSFQGGFNYLIPEQDALPDSAIQESWNIGINLVWHFGCDGCSSHSSPFRPLFNVVDNGTMFIDQTSP